MTAETETGVVCPSDTHSSQRPGGLAGRKAAAVFPELHVSLWPPVGSFLERHMAGAPSMPCLEHGFDDRSATLCLQAEAVPEDDRVGSYKQPGSQVLQGLHGNPELSESGQWRGK